MAVSKRLRYEILRRDNHTCRYCGASAPDVPLRVDHVTPVALGGTDTPDNLVASCEPCNSGKSSATVDSTVVANVADDALRWATAMTRAAEQLRAQEQPKEEYRQAFLSEWNRWHVGKDEDKKVPVPAGWQQSIERFRIAGIPTWMWAEIVDIGMANERVKPDATFRYCCGIAWKKVGELQETARRIVGAASSRPADPELGLIGQAILHIWEKAWTEEHDEAPPQDAVEEFAASLAAGRQRCETDPARTIAAVQMGVLFQGATLNASLSSLESDERCNVVMSWADAWRMSCGEYPDSTLYHHVQEQVDAITEEGTVPSRVERAAIVAGSLLSSSLHYSLSTEDLKKTGVQQWHEHAVDIWARTFSAAASRWPSNDERAALRERLQEISRDSGYLIYDVYAAVAAAGAYQDTDPTTCLQRHLSVFEAAASPLSVA
ncbi:HNH endonuclease [Streptomyces erythrochromogenes]|uniref:HNH endonuclease n=1 Tax=Streptomyces erythrochromogenes TaxID=285574 RepID=UPI002257BBB6|nr:HNH endonuclease [Streptomyces erythrochromogenes]MCX5584235.1 HNH endonuclease [Streptomyces erythrochromogenes]